MALSWTFLNPISSRSAEAFPPEDKKIYVLFDNDYHGNEPIVIKGMMHWYEPGKHEFLKCYTDEDGNDSYLKANLSSNWMYVAWKPVC